MEHSTIDRRPRENLPPPSARVVTATGARVQPQPINPRKIQAHFEVILDEIFIIIIIGCLFVWLFTGIRD